ncbi:MAG: PhzF family phenazine biosynthesis protein [Cyclobacteriaceae bacterium]|nr:PhzF family phenazine biosynthesis protein [Cyclobacteriaceae bacterium]
MKVKLFQVDAFTDHVFGGNPAAVCLLDSWLSDTMMQHIASENNLSETAFIVRSKEDFEIRWFTPELEIDLCGHATLASAHVIFNHTTYSKNTIRFRYKAGILTVINRTPLLTMDFPAISGKPIVVSKQLTNALGKKPKEAFQARDILALFDAEDDVAQLSPDFAKLSKINCMGIIATAPGKNVDFVSRFFAPKAGINEDPVTGSAHCMLIPYWAAKTGKINLEALQISKRMGKLTCAMKGDRVDISGNAVTYMTGEIDV